MRLRVTAVLAVLVAVALGGCSASSSPSGRAASTAPGTTSSEPAPSTPVPTTTAPSTATSSSASTTATPSSTAPTTVPATGTPSTSPVPARSTCTKLTVRVLLGSGAPGYEFAALQFVNDGSSACTLVGVPTVTLLRHGRTVGAGSQPNTDSARFGSYRLAPGAVAESKLKDFSTCNAPLSQSIRVVAPGSSISSTRPGELRACQLVVYPLGAPE